MRNDVEKQWRKKILQWNKTIITTKITKTFWRFSQASTITGSFFWVYKSLLGTWKETCTKGKVIKIRGCLYTLVVCCNEVIRTISNQLIFLWKYFECKKAPNSKQTTFTVLKAFAQAKNYCLCSLLLAYFCLLVDICLWRVYLRVKPFLKKF